MRANCDLFIYLDVPQLLAGASAHVHSLDPCNALTGVLADGVPVYTSTNNVVLTGGIDGVVPPKYFQRVERKNGDVLVPAAA